MTQKLRSELVEAQVIEEGNEILLRPSTGETGIVEDVDTRWARVGAQTVTFITLTDGRTFRVNPHYKVRVFS